MFRTRSLFTSLTRNPWNGVQFQARRSCSSKSGSPIAPAKAARPPPIALPPKKHLAIVTCMDARINPFTQLNLEEGDAHIIRNAGGMARDALRSLIVSQRLLGTREIAIYHHTGCGMVTFTSPSLRKLVKDADPDNTKAAEQVDKIEFLEYSDLEESVRSDVQFLKESPLILKGTKVTGWIHDVDTGTATQIV